MAEKAANLPPRYLRTQEAARFLGLSERTLEKHRTYGTGPTYRKLGGRVVYSVDDLETWTARGAHWRWLHRCWPASTIPPTSTCDRPSRRNRRGWTHSARIRGCGRMPCWKP